MIQTQSHHIVTRNYLQITDAVTYREFVLLRPQWLSGKESSFNPGDTRSIPGSVCAHFSLLTGTPVMCR